MKKETVRNIIKLIVTIITAIATSLGVNSCCSKQKPSSAIKQCSQALSSSAATTHSHQADSTAIPR